MGARVVHVRMFGMACLGAMLACAMGPGASYAAGPETEPFAPQQATSPHAPELLNEGAKPLTPQPIPTPELPPEEPDRADPSREGGRPTEAAGVVTAAATGAGIATGTESRPLGLPRERARETIAESPSGAKASGVAGSELRTLLALGGVVAAILAVAWGVKRVAKAKGGLAGAIGAAGRSPAGLLSVLGRYPIARGQTLILLRVDRRVLLLSQTWARGGARLSTLAEITDPEEVASVLVKAQDAEGESVSERFRAIVERLNHEPSDRAVTVVPPVAKGDWFERVGAKAKKEPASASAVRVQSMSRAPESGARVAKATRGHADGAAALRSRLEAMRAPGGRVS
jgi:flagellar biogenesis protein FliO